ncbi:unnamed protein product [Symbiodinium sp. CCMP2592]|nr:unnamed protein product [Symbiodinium sp. CCMP2592]
MWISGNPSFKRSDDKYARVSRGVWELVLDLQQDVLTQFLYSRTELICRLVEQGAVTLNMSTTREDGASRLVKSRSHTDAVCKLILVLKENHQLRETLQQQRKASSAGVSALHSQLESHILRLQQHTDELRGTDQHHKACLCRPYHEGFVSVLCAVH